jgi:hypothetical protein
MSPTSRLRSIIRRSHLPVTVLASLTRLSRRTVTAWMERNPPVPDRASVDKLAAALERHAERLRELAQEARALAAESPEKRRTRGGRPKKQSGGTP